MNNKQCFPHEFGARNDPKLLDLQMRMGGQGLAIWWCLVEMLHENKGTLPLNPPLIAYQLRWCEASEVERVIREFGLFVIDDEAAAFWNRSALAHCEAKGRESEARAEAGRRGGQANAKQTESKPEANGKQTPSTCSNINNINSIKSIKSLQESAGAGSPAREKDLDDLLYEKFFFRDFARPDLETPRARKYCADNSVNDVVALAEKWEPKNKTPRFNNTAILAWVKQLHLEIICSAGEDEGAAFLRNIDGITVDKSRNVLRIRMLTREWGETVAGLVLDNADLRKPYDDIETTMRNPETL